MSKLNEEIDLKDIALKIVTYIKKYRVLLLVFFILGLGAGIYKYFTTKPYYNAQMIITSNLEYEKSNDIYVKNLQPIVSVLNFLSVKINGHNNEFIINELGVEHPAAINNFTVTVVKDINLASADPENILIEVIVFNKSVLSEIQTSIINYCNNNEYISNYFKQQQKLNSDALYILDNRINQVDSINEILLDKESVLPTFIDLSGLVGLELKKNKLNLDKMDSNPVVIVQKFSEFPDVVSKKAVSAVVYFLIFVVLGFISILVLETFKFFKNA